MRLGLLVISVAFVAGPCAPEERPPALTEQLRLALWAEHVSLEARLRAAGDDPVLLEDRDRFLAQTETRYGVTLADLSRWTAEHGQRWLASSGCKPPAGPIRQHALVVRPHPSRPLHPAYTPAACAHRIEGIAIVELVVSPAGRAEAVRVLRGLPHGLTETAHAAVSQTRWHPALLCGKPVAAHYTVTVSFDLPDPSCFEGSTEGRQPQPGASL